MEQNINNVSRESFLDLKLPRFCRDQNLLAYLPEIERNSNNHSTTRPKHFEGSETIFPEFYAQLLVLWRAILFVMFYIGNITLPRNVTTLCEHVL